jgi:hypothetical protein
MDRGRERERERERKRERRRYSLPNAINCIQQDLPQIEGSHIQMSSAVFAIVDLAKRHLERLSIVSYKSPFLPCFYLFCAICVTPQERNQERRRKKGTGRKGKKIAEKDRLREKKNRYKERRDQ